MEKSPCTAITIIQSRCEKSRKPSWDNAGLLTARLEVTVFLLTMWIKSPRSRILSYFCVCSWISECQHDYLNTWISTWQDAICIINECRYHTKLVWNSACGSHYIENSVNCYLLCSKLAGGGTWALPPRQVVIKVLELVGGEEKEEPWLHILQYFLFYLLVSARFSYRWLLPMFPFPCLLLHINALFCHCYTAFNYSAIVCCPPFQKPAWCLLFRLRRLRSKKVLPDWQPLSLPNHCFFTVELQWTFHTCGVRVALLCAYITLSSIHTNG